MAIRSAKITITLLSVVYAAVVLTTFTADRLVALSFRPVFITPTLDQRLSMVELAGKLDPLDGEIPFRKFFILQEIRVSERRRSPSRAELHALRDAIRLRQLWPRYQLYYGLLLERMSPSPNIMTRQKILSQLKRASDLKPYSSLYRSKYLDYLEKYGDQDTFPGEHAI